MKNHKVKAFTIMEVTITMLIAGLLIGITYTSYSIILKSYHSFTCKNDDMAVLTTIDHLLTRDFEQAEMVAKTGKGIKLTHNDKIIEYEFSPDFITRDAVRIDTFKVQTADLNTMYENIPINEIQETDENNRIDDMSFTLMFQQEKIPCHYHKLYSSVNLLLQKPDAIN